ncbi:MAG TPA: hypothetical protein ENJ18_01425 [Nannocystis exedens]|nr:hypothetical protein [Nannocystis exedens]
MTKQVRQICLVSLLVAGAWAIPHVASACSCLPPEPPKEALEKAQAVFVGRVLEISEEGGGDMLARRRYRFEVSRFWKGELGETITLSSAASSAACGRSYAQDEQYLIYASTDPNGGGLVDFLCSRTRTLASADEDLAVLGPGKVVETPLPTTTPSDREPPRIEPPQDPASEPPATEPSPKGCTISATESTPPLGLAVLLLLSIAFRRNRRP